MEASRRQPLDQLAFEERGSVRLLGDRIVIEALSVSDERAAKVVRERAETGAQPAETVAKAIEIGARVIDSESTATNVDYVQRVFEERVGKLGEDLNERLEEGSAEIAKHIGEKFDVDRADSVQGEIKQMLVTAAEHQRRELTSMLTSEDGEQPARRGADALREGDARGGGAPSQGAHLPAGEPREANRGRCSRASPT